MADDRESPSSARVRELIFAYERHTSSTKPLEEYNGRPRAKSIGNTLSYKLFRQPNVEFHSIMEIEKELVKIEAHLNYYEKYEKETHVAFQEQLFNVLTSLVNIDPEDQEGLTELKRKLILETQKLATDLNSRLPYDGSSSYKGTRRTYSTYVRKEEAVVSTTSVKNHEHRAVLSSQNSTIQNSTLNGGFKSEESLNSTKDSVDLSSRQDESSSIELNYLEERPRSSTPPPQKKIVDETQSTVLPSVSRLKKFFSFRKEAKPEIEVTTASYSGLSRSQSLNIKTNKHSASKRNKKEERKRGEAIHENDEIIENVRDGKISSTSSKQIINSSQRIDSSQTINSSQIISASQTINTTGQPEPIGDIEPLKEVAENGDEQNEIINNVSVTKLKSLFEKSQDETNEGLGLLTKKHIAFSSDLDLPFTAMNLGAYRLKRTISGNYMNFAGLIRHVDIHKKGGDLSKSKSLSDLKITNYSHGARDLEVDDELDLSQEIDDDDDFEHVSIDVGKDTKELNNNTVRDEVVNKNVDDIKEPLKKEEIQFTLGSSNTEEYSTQEVSTSETSQIVRKETESIFLSKSVETLKQQFENLSANSRLANKEANEEVNQVVYKTKIEPVRSTSSIVVEPELKEPIQLKPAFINVSELIENSSNSRSNEETNDDVRSTSYKTLEPIPSISDRLEEPKLKVPIQLRPGFVNAVSSQETSAGISVVTEKFIRNERVSNQTNETVTSGGIVETLKQTFENISTTSDNDLNNEEIRHVLHRTIEPISSSSNGVEEPVLKVPIQLRVGVGNVSPSNDEVTESINSTSSTGVHNKDIHRTIEPIPSIGWSQEPVLKVPIQLRFGNALRSQSNEDAENTVVTSTEHTQTVQETNDSLASTGTVEILTQSFENLSSTTSSEVNNDDIKHIIHRTIEPSPSNTDGSEEPVLKVPIQLRIGIARDSHGATENTAVLESTEHTYTVQEPNDSLASPGTVEILTQSFENLSSTNSAEVNNDDIKHVIHRTIEPIQGNTDGSEEPVLRVPIQLRFGFAQHTQSHEATENIEVLESTEHTYTVQEPSDSLSSPGTVENLTQSFENLSSSTSSEVNNDDIKSIIHRTIESIPSNTDGSEEPVLKVPIQLRVGFGHAATENTDVLESTELTYTVQEPIDSLTSQGTVEILENTFENMSVTNSSEVSNDNVNQIHRTIEPIPSNSNSSEEPVLKVPIQLRTFTYDGQSQNDTENLSSISSTEVRTDDINHVVHRNEEVPSVPRSPKPVLTAPIELRTGFVSVNQSSVVSGNLEVDENRQATEVFLHNERRHSDELIGNEVNSGETVILKHESVPTMNVALSNNIQDETFSSQDGSMSRSRIEEKTGSFMRVLESPSEFSSKVSSSSLSQSQQSSSTKVSYSEKRTIQQTSSTHVSQRIVSSSSSSSASLSSRQSGQSYLQVLEEPVSYSLLRSINAESPREESEVSITEVGGELNARRKIKVNLNVSQENIFNEILNDGDSLENVDEEFEKMLQENSK